MKRIHIAVITAFSVFALSGCSLCPPGYLDDYGAVGGKWQRANPTHGRVGSRLSDAGYSAGDLNDSTTIYEDAPVIESGEVYYEEGYDQSFDSPSDVIMLDSSY